LESGPIDRFTSAPSNSIVVRAADDVDVVGNSDRRQGLSALTTSPRQPPPAAEDTDAVLRDNVKHRPL
jgi:hypothetical protein